VKKKDGIKEYFAGVPRRLLRSDLFRMVGFPARHLYTCMLDAMFDPNDAYMYTSKRCVAYSPTQALAMGFTKPTYYRAERQLVENGIISRIDGGGHGRKATYDLMAWEYSPLVRPLEKCGRQDRQGVEGKTNKKLCKKEKTR